MKRTIILAAAAMALFAVAGTLAAQQPAAPGTPVPVLSDGKGQVILTWDEFVKITGYDPTKKDSAQVLTVPWAEVEKLLGVKVENAMGKTTVDLPWEEFKSLLEWSAKRQTPEKAPPPPTGYIVTSSQYKGAITDTTADFTLTLKLNILQEKGWKSIPILPANVAVVETAFVPADGVYLNSSNGQYELLTDKTGPIEATIKFSVNVEKSGGINAVSFGRQHAGSSVLDLTIDRENVEVRVAAAQSVVTKSDKGKTVTAAAVPTGQPVSISWERALPKVEAVPAKLYAETRTLVAVADDMLLCRETVDYNILHSAVRELTLSVPKGASVLTVTGRTVQDWRVADDGKMTVVLRGEAVGAYSLDVNYEQPAKGDVAAPVIRASGVERERGYVGVIAVANVELTAGDVAGATKIDVRQLPAEIAAMTSQPILLAFRYVEPKIAIPLAIKKHAEVGVLVTIADSVLATGMQLNDGRRMTKMLYSVRNNREQFLRLTMPKDAEIWSVSVGGNPVSPAKDDKGAVLIPLIRSTAAAARELASFPVEIVYIETPAQVPAEKGSLHVELPTCDAPVMHVMYNFYAPAEGEYTVGWGRSGFSGPLSVVGEFSRLTAGPAAAVVTRNAQAQAQQMASQFQAQADTAIRTTGATPIRVDLPLNGKLFHLEKILALSKDRLFFDVEYSKWRGGK